MASCPRITDIIRAVRELSRGLKALAVDLDCAERGYAFRDFDFGMAGAIAFPALVPITPAHDAVAENRAAWQKLTTRKEPFLTLWCPDDPVLGHLASMFIDRIPGADGQPHQTFTPGGHFIQDDCGEDIAAALLTWWKATE